MGVALRAHPVRGESHIQRNDNGEAATLPLCRNQGLPSMHYASTIKRSQILHEVTELNLICRNQSLQPVIYRQ